MPAFLHDLLVGLSSLFYPRICPCCLSEDSIELCRERWKSIPTIRFIEQVPLYSVHPYDHRAMSVVMAAKERGERLAKDLLATAIASTIDRVVIPHHRSFIIPIPSSKRALRQRGEDFIYQLGRSVSSRTRLRTPLLPALMWKREVADQSRLSERERVANLDQALRIDENEVERLWIHHRLTAQEKVQIILIDDVVTSGSTMRAAISAISHSSLAPRSTLLGVTACHSAKPF